jgi:HlyD family secretion protein
MPIENVGTKWYHRDDDVAKELIMKQKILSKRSILIGTGLLLGLAIICLVSCNDKADNQPAPTQPSDQNPVYQPAAGSVTANGTLKPAQQVQLSFGVGGTVESVVVEIGEHVKEGQTLATLDDVELERAVAQTQVELKSAQARLAQLEEDAIPVPERVLAATTAISSAQAALTQAHIQAGMREHYDTIDRETLEDAEEALEDAQNEYQKVVNDPFKREWAHDSPEAHDLEEAQEYYEVVKAQYELHAADHDYAVAIAQAEAQLAQAQLALYEAQHPIPSEALTLAQLDVEQAQLALDAARDSLAHATLEAPFDGIVSTVPISVDERVSPSTQAIELVDVSHWRVETKNVGELQIAQVKEGQEAIVRVNAFQGEPLQGRVATISPVAVVQQGDTTYTLTITLEDTDGADGLRLNLRPEMTARVEIVVE